MILSRLDYCNSLYTVLRAKDRKRLQSIQNRAARLVFSVGARSHTTPLISDLHWLPVQQRITFKTCLYIFKILNSLSPQYLSNTIQVYTPSRTLRSSSDTHKLAIPKCQLTVSERRFSVAAAKSWNSIPLAIRSISNSATFKRNLKTYLFPQ